MKKNVYQKPDTRIEYIATESLMSLSANDLGIANGGNASDNDIDDADVKGRGNDDAWTDGLW